MKKFLTSIFFFAALALFAYEFRGYFFPPGPCEEPIEYKVGDFAPEFKVTQKYFLDAVADAEAVWEEAMGRELFVHAPDAEERDALRMNLIYDYRQETTKKLESIGTVLEENQGSYDALKTEFESLRRIYERERAGLEASVRSFNQRQMAYEAEVKYWNDRGGAPETEYKKLDKERKALQAEAGMLERQQAELNETADEVNALVAGLNALAKKLNLSAENYNTVSDSRGETFEEGLYISDGRQKEINIYEFEDRAELVRLLVHEFGHALSLDHVSDPEAIMYELNQSKNLVLTPADLAELALRCGTAAD